MTTGLRVAPHQIEPLGTTGTTLPDGTYGISVVDGVVTGYALPTPATRVLPLTTSVNGVPDLVWDNDGSLVYSEVSS